MNYWTLQVWRNSKVQFADQLIPMTKDQGLGSTSVADNFGDM